MERIENRTFDELEPGDTANLVRTLTYIRGETRFFRSPMTGSTRH